MSRRRIVKTRWARSRASLKLRTCRGRAPSSRSRASSSRWSKRRIQSVCSSIMHPARATSASRWKASSLAAARIQASPPRSARRPSVRSGRSAARRIRPMNIWSWIRWFRARRHWRSRWRALPDACLAVLTHYDPRARRAPFQSIERLMTSALFTPYKINGLELANRITVAPMCQYSAADGVIGDWHLTHLGMLANSGAGLVFVEMTDVERRGRITHGCVGIYSDDCETALTRVIAHCRRIGTAKFGIQIAHAGRKASSQRPWEGGKGLKPDQDPWETIGPSAIPFGADWPAPRQMTEQDIDHVRDGYVNGAKRALRAGFDTIQLHMAHGYLIHAFTSPISNRRNDRYGGDLNGRMTFSLEVIRAVRAVVPKDYPVGARISAVDWVDGRLTGG